MYVRRHSHLRERLIQKLPSWLLQSSCPLYSAHASQSLLYWNRAAHNIEKLKLQPAYHLGRKRELNQPRFWGYTNAARQTTLLLTKETDISTHSPNRIKKKLYKNTNITASLTPLHCFSLATMYIGEPLCEHLLQLHTTKPIKNTA